jgi:hypothetical protein
MENPNTHFSLHAIEPISSGFFRGGADDEDFDPAILPFEISPGLTIEDVSPLIRHDEFAVFENFIGKDTYEHLSRLKYAIIHRFPELEFDESERIIAFNRDLVIRSRALVREAAACLRLLRPTTQYLHFFEGHIDTDGFLTRVAFDTPLDSVINPISHRTLAFRSVDAHSLRFYLPRFREGMAGEFWKFRMCVSMHESGHFQNYDWRAKFFLWTTAIESLFTTQSRDMQHSGSLVARERIKSFLGESTPIYPPDELSSAYTYPNLTVADVVGDLYCLRNHIAHGDRIPPYYSESGRANIYGDDIARSDMLLEASSFIIRHSLLKILRDGLLNDFKDAEASQAYFGGQGLTKSLLTKSAPHYPCAT